MSTNNIHDHNVALVRRWFEEVWNRRRVETVDELLSKSSVCYAEDGPIRGVEEFKARMHTPFLAAFPDLRVAIEAALAQDDQVVVRWTASGTHWGEGLGCPASGQQADFRGITWVRIRDGQLVEGWQSSDIPEVVRQLANVSLDS
jgi:steroid delta-isomerase-like uncharacterized protein